MHSPLDDSNTKPGKITMCCSTCIMVLSWCYPTHSCVLKQDDMKWILSVTNPGCRYVEGASTAGSLGTAERSRQEFKIHGFPPDVLVIRWLADMWGNHISGNFAVLCRLCSLFRWKHLEEDAKHRVVIDCGCLFVAEKGHPFIKDYIDACQKFQVRSEDAGAWLKDQQSLSSFNITHHT